MLARIDHSRSHATRRARRIAGDETRRDRTHDSTTRRTESLLGWTPELGPTGRPLREFPEPKRAEARTAPPASSPSATRRAASARPRRRSTSARRSPSTAAACSRRLRPAGRAVRGARRADPRRADDLRPAARRAATTPPTRSSTPASPGLDVIPANIDLSAAEVHLVNEVAREQILARVLRQVAADYDVILIDCQPSLGLLTVNALTASHGVLIPLECEFFALRGVALLDRDDRQGARPAEPGDRARRHPRDDVRLAHAALARGARAGRRRVRRQGARDGHQRAP